MHHLALALFLLSLLFPHPLICYHDYVYYVAPLFADADTLV